MTDRRDDPRPLAEAAHPRSPETGELNVIGTLELREERLIIEKEREVAGTVTFSREVRRETVQVPVELVTEVLVIEHTAGRQLVTLDGLPLAPGERREVLIYREEASVDKRVVLSEQVRVSKRQTVETRTFDATLAREELLVSQDGEVQLTGDLTDVVTEPDAGS